MSKLFRTVVASSVIGGVALLSPLSAQARSLTPISATPVYESCIDASTLQGSVTGQSWKVRIPATVFGTDAKTLQYRVRSYNDGAGGKSVVVADKTRAGSFVTNPDGSYTVSGTATGKHIFRMDIADPAREAAGVLALLYTTDGAAACD